MQILGGQIYIVGEQESFQTRGHSVKMMLLHLQNAHGSELPDVDVGAISTGGRELLIRLVPGRSAICAQLPVESRTEATRNPDKRTLLSVPGHRQSQTRLMCLLNQDPSA